MTALQSMMFEIMVLAAMILMVVGLAYYRHTIAKQQDFHLHVNEAQGVTDQSSVAQRLMMIDRWGKVLTALTAVYFLVLVGMMMYKQWTQAGTLG